MKIGFLIGNMSHSGGTERVLQQIANGLAARGYHILVISVWGTDRLFFPLDPAVTFRRLGDAYPDALLEHARTIGALRKVLKSERVDVLVDVDLILALYTLPATIGIPELKRISWEHFNFYFLFPKNNRLRAIARRLAGYFSDAIVVLTEEDRGNYARNLKIRGKLCKIYNPNPFQKAVSGAAEKQIVFAAGSLAYIKGFDLLLESWSLLEKDFPGWRLCIAGEGEERAALLQLCQEKGLRSVEFLGNVSDMESRYGQSAFYVMPSRYEGFGMVLIEAMSFGKAAVSFDCPTGPRDIITDGENGFLVPVGDTAGFSRKMRCLMESPELRREMGRKARQSIGRFDRAVILDQWEALLHSFA